MSYKTPVARLKRGGVAAACRSFRRSNGSIFMQTSRPVSWRLPEVGSMQWKRRRRDVYTVFSLRADGVASERAEPSPA